MSPHDLETAAAYDIFADDFAGKFNLHFTAFIRAEADRFLDHLPGNRVLDLGSAAGRHSAYFREQHCHPVCFDSSEALIQRCRAQGLPAVLADMRNLPFASGSFDGVWSYNSLLHLPKKDLPGAVDGIARVLGKNGILGVAVKEGEGEGFETHARYPGVKRYFSYFTDAEFRGFFDSRFQFIYASRMSVSGEHRTSPATYLDYLFRLKLPSKA